MNTHLILNKIFNSGDNQLRGLFWVFFMLLASVAFYPVSAQEVLPKTPANKTQKPSQKLANLNPKLKTGQKTNIPKAKFNNTLPQNIPSTKQQNITTPGLKSIPQNSNSSHGTFPPKPMKNTQLTAPPSRRIPGSNPSARAAQIIPNNRAAQLNPASRTAQLNPANKANQLNPNNKPQVPKAKSTKRSRPIRDIKYKREHYKAKRNNG